MLKSIESIVGATLLILSLIVFLSGMVLRLAGFSVGGWIEEVTIYLVVWGLLLAAASCVTYGEHVRADFFLRLIGERFRYFADILASVSGFLFCIIMAWFGWLVVEFALAWDERGAILSSNSYRMVLCGFTSIHGFYAPSVTLSICFKMIKGVLTR